MTRIASGNGTPYYLWTPVLCTGVVGFVTGVKEVLGGTSPVRWTGIETGVQEDDLVLSSVGLGPGGMWYPYGVLHVGGNPRSAPLVDARRVGRLRDLSGCQLRSRVLSPPKL